MTSDLQLFFSACLGAGAILTGFCGTFLSFRIQREANYHRQPSLDFTSGTAKDIAIGLSHFTSSFLLLIIASLLAVVFGFLLPLLALAGVAVAKQLVVAGMMAAIVFIAGYFTCEMVHYDVLSRRLLNDRSEWGRSRGIVAATGLLAVVVAVIIIMYV